MFIGSAGHPAFPFRGTFEDAMNRLGYDRGDERSAEWRRSVVDRGRARRAFPLTVALAAALAAPGPRPAGGQEQLANFSRPIPVLSTGGHNAPVRALQFTPDGGAAALGGAGQDRQRLEPPRRPAPPGADAPPADLARLAGGDLRHGPLPAAGRRQGAAAPGRRRLRRRGPERGNIFLYAYAPRDAAATGRVEAHLHSGNPADRDPEGHTDTVMALAFSPRRARPSPPAALDGTARLWDVATPEDQRRSSAGTPARSTPWPSAPTAPDSPPGEPMAPSASGRSPAPRPRRSSSRRTPASR